MSTRRAVTLACALAASPLLAACPKTAPPAAVDAGAPVDAGGPGAPPETFTKLCAPCHGADATGYRADNAPSLVSSTFLESASDDYLVRSITRGRPGTPMAAYGKALHGPLDEGEIRAIVSWLRKQGPAPRAMPDGKRGDASAGGALYADRCQSCHGDARMRGEAVGLFNPEAQAVLTPGFVRHAIANGRPGTKMKAFGGELAEGAIDDLVAWIVPPPAPFDVAHPQGPDASAQLPPPTGKEPLVINPGGKAPDFTPRSDPCPPAPDGGPPCVPNRRYVPAAQVKAALAAKRRLIIVDARPESDWMRLHVPGAIPMPHYDPKRINEIPKDGTWVIAYCACPHHLSGDLVDALRARGVKNSAILDEGILVWERLGYPVVRAPAP